eukprot:bmy_17108T0
MEADACSIYVGNVDYGATAEELEAHFNGCGSVNRVTILCDKFSGHPKGFACIEFSDKESISVARRSPIHSQRLQYFSEQRLHAACAVTLGGAARSPAQGNYPQPRGQKDPEDDNIIFKPPHSRIDPPPTFPAPTKDPEEGLELREH